MMALYQEKRRYFNEFSVINYRKLQEIKFQFLPSGILRSNIMPQDKALQCRSGLTTFDVLKVAMIRTAKHSDHLYVLHMEREMRTNRVTDILHAVLRDTCYAQ
jgi:hypothetical protein